MSAEANQHSELKPLVFHTPRLQLAELTADGLAVAGLTAASAAKVGADALLSRILALFTPAVIVHLPPYFAKVQDLASAKAWLERMLVESRLLTVTLIDDLGKTKSSPLIGFLFIYEQAREEAQAPGYDAHLGYLLGEEYWGQGLASELLTGLLSCAHQNKDSLGWQRLVAGVGMDNPASSRVLEKAGFRLCPDIDAEAAPGVLFYYYSLS
ncbi:GNAT family N-acetyltransferase [Shewanella sedimentimangrovi]|uniref:GNAT family N-acetyltransferase n=1 Tax=Shewanella sedimentimangrovi TaxID=2814293 RepID=A0ABX7R522_9GAMM|nr:GNAT family N-acetyltransferase [Shewanella sedimentimangrovi]QSX38261.1 GNAT family N-acetyltransferase [Shewanella sedimentimangrovi]